jgi:50S ribosomal protein L16 3-hydroxylase
VMVSYASPGGGVGPHFDSYDVFLLQAHGSRRWRIGQQQDLTLRAGVPLKILANFEFEEEFVLHPGDMLYLPPRYAHEGVAVDECMTYSIGFRAPERRSLGVELLQRMLDEYQEDIDGDQDGDGDGDGDGEREGGANGADDAEEPHVAPAPVLAPILYRDAKQTAVEHPAEIPATMQLFAEKAMADVLAYARHVPRWLGEQMTEPKPKTVFQATKHCEGGELRLDGATRMLYDARHVYINGESYRAAGADARLMRKLADQRALDARDMGRASEDARNLIADWCDAGWAHGSV